MIDQAFAETFATEWIDSWNSHDMSRILAHYTDDFAFSSPRIITLMGESSGILKGKAAIGAYWTKALGLRPDLHFELLTVLTGISGITLYYRSLDRRLATEVFDFNADGKVIQSAAYYAQ